MAQPSKTQFGYVRHPDQDRSGPDAVEHPVVVVGAGPVGLSLAIDLAHPVSDCVYLALAESLDDALLTADRRFLRAVAATPHEARVRELGK